MSPFIILNLENWLVRMHGFRDWNKEPASYTDIFCWSSRVSLWRDLSAALWAFVLHENIWFCSGPNSHFRREPSLSIPRGPGHARETETCPCGYCVWKASSYFCCCRMQTRLSLLLAIALLILVSCTKTTTSYPKLVSNSILLPLHAEDSYSCYCY